MHDFFEGICHYDLIHNRYYIDRVKLFSLNDLNFRIQNYNYAIIVCTNIPPIITHNDLKAKEMKCIMHYITLMISDLVPRDDEVFLLTLIQILIFYCQIDSTKQNYIF